MTDGIILLDKPQGLSSAQALAAVKKKLRLKKIGHAGTLDPLATGLLICLIGRATRLARFAEGGTKVYSGVIQLGIRTDTDDVTGEVLERSERLPALNEIRSYTGQLTGKIMQRPPQYSALKINGKRAYQRARAGEEVQIAPRSVLISHFDVDMEEGGRVSFSVGCSKGTYIRSLARDLGEMLGCGGTLAELRREESAPFSIRGSSGLEDLSEGSIRPWRELFPSDPLLEIPLAEAQALKGGCQKTLAAVAERHGDELKGFQRALYSSDSTQDPLGLLLFDGQHWQFGVNI